MAAAALLLLVALVASLAWGLSCRIGERTAEATARAAASRARRYAMLTDAHLLTARRLARLLRRARRRRVSGTA